MSDDIPQVPVLTWNGNEWVPTMEVSDDEDDIPDSDVIHTRLSAKEDDSITESDGTVTSWDDLVGNNNFDSGPGGVFVDSGFNDHPVVEFDDDWLFVDGWDGEIETPYAVFTVFEFQSLGSQDSVYGGENTEGGSISAIQHLDDEWYMWNGNSFTEGEVTTDTQIMTAIFDDGSNSRIRINGEVEASGDAGGRTFEDGSDYALAYSIQNEDYESHIQIGEHIVCHDVPDDIEGFENYLENEWGPIPGFE